MATLTVVSDLHLEARPLSLDDILDADLVSDVLCLLGDIGDPSSPAYRDFLAACAARFPTVLLLAGNNEYRNHDGSGGRNMAQTEDLIRQAAAVHPNVHFLQNSTHVVGDTAFIGTTLWSYLPDTPLPPPLSEQEQQQTGEPAGGSGGAAAAPAAAAVGSAKLVEPPPPPPVPQFLEACLGSAAPASAAAPGAAGDDLAQDAVVELSILGSPAAAATVATALPLQRLPTAPVPLPPPQQQQHQLQPSVGLSPWAQWAHWRHQRKHGQQSRPEHGGVPLPISVPRRPTGPRTAPSGIDGAAGTPVAVIPRPPAPPPPPRFMSHSMPPLDWLSTPEQVTPCDSVANGCGCGAGSAGVGGRREACRRRTLRHCVSLASLRPDEPCPSWRAIQARCASGRGGSSSESDARSSSDSDSSQSSDEEGSDEASPYVSGNSIGPGGGCRMMKLPAVGKVAAGGGGGPFAAIHAEQGLSKECDVQTSRVASARSLNGASARTAPTLPCSSALTPASSGTLPVLPYSHGPLSQPPAAGGLTAQGPAQPPSALPTFLSEPGSLSSSFQPPFSTPATAIIAANFHSAATVAAPGASPAPMLAAEAVASGGAAAAEPSPKPRHHHGHSHGHHHRHSSSHGRDHAPPPATVREFIGATSLDFRRIFLAPGGPPITPDDTNALFTSSLEFIRGAVAAARARGLVPIVLSHHAPSMSGTSRPAFAGHPSTHAYSTDLEPYLAGSGVAAWYCGHTHYNFDRLLEGGVRLASNQFGSQPKPAEGYSRTWQHRLPTISGGSSAGGRVTAESTPAAAGKAPEATHHLNSRASWSAAPPPPLSLGAAPLPASAVA